MNRKASYVSVAEALAGLTADELSAIADKPELLKKFARGLVADIAANTFIVHIDDEDVPEQHRQTVAKWRNYAAFTGYAGPVAWRVKAGFTLKKHAPLAGPCYEKLEYLQGWDIPNDEPTTDSIVFWVPRLAEDSIGRGFNSMKTLRAELKQRFELPEGHATTFGSIALLFALILAHFKRTGERVPLQALYAASDTAHVGSLCLCAGRFGTGGLLCNEWRRATEDSLVGFFLLGVEELGK